MDVVCNGEIKTGVLYEYHIKGNMIFTLIDELNVKFEYYVDENKKIKFNYNDEEKIKIIYDYFTSDKCKIKLSEYFMKLFEYRYEIFRQRVSFKDDILSSRDEERHYLQLSPPIAQSIS